MSEKGILLPLLVSDEKKVRWIRYGTIHTMRSRADLAQSPSKTRANEDSLRDAVRTLFFVTSFCQRTGHLLHISTSEHTLCYVR